MKTKVVSTLSCLFVWSIVTVLFAIYVINLLPKFQETELSKTISTIIPVFLYVGISAIIAKIIVDTITNNTKTKKGRF